MINITTNNIYRIKITYTDDLTVEFEQEASEPRTAIQKAISKKAYYYSVAGFPIKSVEAIFLSSVRMRVERMGELYAVR